jgi:hypothetical protein
MTEKDPSSLCLASFAAAGSSWSQEDDSWLKTIPLRPGELRRTGNSWPIEDDSGRKTTSHVEVAEHQAGFCSVLSPQHSLLIY